MIIFFVPSVYGKQKQNKASHSYKPIKTVVFHFISFLWAYNSTNTTLNSKSYKEICDAI